MTEVQKIWLMKLIEGMVTVPRAANIGILQSRCDLEVILRVATVDEVIFTEEVLNAIKTLVAQVTRVTAPVVYVHGKEPEWLAKGAYI